jgi:hypothetical protein
VPAVAAAASWIAVELMSGGAGAAAEHRKVRLLCHRRAGGLTYRADVVSPIPVVMILTPAGRD